MFRVHSRLAALLVFALPLWAVTESQYPDTIAAQSGFTACVVASIDDDPDSADANWCNVADASNIATSVRVTFPTPTGPPTDGAGLQSFRIQWRKTSQSTNPSCTVELYENGGLIGTVVASTAVSSTTGVVVSGTWDSASLATNNGSQVEALVTCAVGGGGASNRASGEVGAVEWVVNYTPSSGRFKKFIAVTGD